jgi:hypothetical protein
MLVVNDCFKVGRIYGISVTINRNILLKLPLRTTFRIRSFFVDI